MGEGVTPLAAALTAMGSVWTQITTMITGSSVLMMFLAGSLLGTGFRLFKRAKKAVR